MTTHTLASSRRRTTLVALAIALVAGVAALAVADGTDAPTTASIPMVTVVPAPLPAAVQATAGMASSSMQAVDPSGTVADGADTPSADIATATDAMSAPADFADDPLADVILVAVDPADALLADHQEAVAVSD